jgi:hypothetical protein
LGPDVTAAFNRPIVPAPGDYDDGEIGGMLGRGKPKYSEKTCPSAALSTPNPTSCPDANPGRCCWKPATNRLSYGTAFVVINYYKMVHEQAIYYSKGSISIDHQ